MRIFVRFFFLQLHVVDGEICPLSVGLSERNAIFGRRRERYLIHPQILAVDKLGPVTITKPRVNIANTPFGCAEQTCVTFT